MTPKEKATQLYEKYKSICDSLLNSTQNKEIAKDYSLIAIEEIIISVENEHVSEIFELFWQQVKKEIEAI